jgi:hypothetical protein
MIFFLDGVHPSRCIDTQRSIIPQKVVNKATSYLVIAFLFLLTIDGKMFRVCAGKTGQRFLMDVGVHGLFDQFMKIKVSL